MSFIDQLNWRYATKKFNPAKKVSAENLATIMETIRLTPSSFGLQPYHFYVIANNEANQAKLEAVTAAAWNQPQISTCSELIVMCSRTNLVAVKNEFFELLSGGNAEARVKLADYEGIVNNFLPNASEDWAKKQVYIAAGFAMAACAELAIDSCPMEGFDAAAVTQILNIPAEHAVTMLLPIGYRADDEQPRPKTRFAQDGLFTQI